MSSNPLRKEAHELLNCFLNEPSHILCERFADKMKLCINEDVDGYIATLKEQTKHLYSMYREAEKEKLEAVKKVDTLTDMVQRQTIAIRRLEMELLHATIEKRKAPQLK